MSTIIKVVPSPHETKRTTMIRIPDDGQVATRVEDPMGTVTDKSFDFSSYDEGTDELVNNEPLISVSAQKLGADARFIISITEFYDDNLTGDSAPQERFLWYGYNVDLKDAPPDDTPLTATPQNPLYILYSSAGVNPVSPTVAYNIQAQTTTLASQYTRLGTAAERRSYLRHKIIGILESPYLMWLLGGGMMPAISTQSTSNQRSVNITFDRSQRVQGFWFWLEIIARAISLDSNLEGANGERNFNLLDGELSLDIVQLIGKISTSLPGDIAKVAARTGWHFRRFGNVGSSSPYTYIVPSYNVSTMPTAHDTTINIGSSVPSEVTTNWLLWLRSSV